MTMLKPKREGPTPSEKLIEGAKRSLRRFGRFMWSDFTRTITIKRGVFYILLAALIKVITAFFTFG